MKLNRVIVYSDCVIPDGLSIGIGEQERGPGYFDISSQGIVIVTQDGVNKRSGRVGESKPADLKHSENTAFVSFSATGKYSDYLHQVDYSGNC